MNLIILFFSCIALSNAVIVPHSKPCGNGNIGNKRCINPSLCCSIWGHCGTTSPYCKAGNCLGGPCVDRAPKISESLSIQPTSSLNLPSSQASASTLSSSSSIVAASASTSASKPQQTQKGAVIKAKLDVSDITHFDDDQYQCDEWNYRAKSAIAQGYLFAATNFKLVSPNLAPPYQIKCGGAQYLCARALPSEKEYYIIDWCDPTNLCSQKDAQHLDILVQTESSDGINCNAGCSPYTSFVKSTTSWELVECSVPINAANFAIQSGSSSVNN